MLVHRASTASRGAALAAFLIVLLGAWAFVVPLVGPYFDFGLHTGDTWSFSEVHWILSLAPGLAVAAGGMAMLGTTRVPARLAGLTAAAGGAWLVVGPILYPLWSSGELGPVSGPEWKVALLWIAYHAGVGALVLLLTGLALALPSRLPAVAEAETIVEEPPPERRARHRIVMYP